MARSLLAEAILNRRGFTLGRQSVFRAFSAGYDPASAAHPMALSLLAERGYTTRFARPKSWRRFKQPAAPDIDLVIDLYAGTERRPGPELPGAPPCFVWPIADPTTASTDGPTLRKELRRLYQQLEARIETLLAAHDARAAPDQRRRVGARRMAPLLRDRPAAPL